MYFIYFLGITNLSRLLAYDIKPIDTWIFYELCGESLGNSLYDLKGSGNIGGERVYKVNKSNLIPLNINIIKLF